MAKKKNNPNQNWMWIIAILLILFLFFRGGDLFGAAPVTKTEDIVIKETEVSEYRTCTELCAAYDFNRGYAGNTVDDCVAGDTFITYGYEGEPPLLSCCCFTHVEEEAPEEDEIPAEPYCTDSDGGVSEYVGGYVTDFRGTVYDDCTDSSTLKEYYCKGSTGAFTVVTCPWGYVCLEEVGGDSCNPIDTDGDGYSDADEAASGTDPNDPNSYPGSPIEEGIEYCLSIGFAGYHYMPDSSPSGCLGYAYNTCFPEFGLQYEDSSYSDPHCCFDCIGW